MKRHPTAPRNPSTAVTFSGIDSVGIDHGSSVLPENGTVETNEKIEKVHFSL